MTVETINTIAGPYLANGIATAFPFSFKVMLPEEVAVISDVAGARYTVSKSLFTVTIGEQSGTVVFAVAPVAGQSLYVVPDPSFQQGISFSNQAPFLPESHNEANDRSAVRDLYLLDGLRRSIRLPEGESALALPTAGLRAGKLLGFDGLGRPTVSNGQPGAAGIPGPTDWHSQNALAALPNLSAAVRTRAFTDTPIKLAGFGSSNGLNENGGLSGPGNSPVEIALRQLKAVFDPFGTCVWEFEQFSVNGTGYSGWNTAIDRPMSPRAFIEAYGPDLVVGCYGTNDYAPEAFNVGETRGLIPFFLNDILAWCYRHNADAIIMIPPAPHVGYSKQTRADPVTGLPVQGRALNYTVPTSYPNRSFQRGQQNEQAPGGDLLVTFSGGNTITASAGDFDDGSLYPGAVIWVAHPDLLSPIVNSGYYRVASVSGDKSQIVLNNVVTVNAYDYVVGAPVTLTNAGPIRVTIWRVAIDPFTELTPSFTEAFDFIEVGGVQVEVTTREQIVSQDIRQQCAASPYNVILLDMMYDYLRGVIANGEDRYYTQPTNPSDPRNNVHWNSVCVDEVVEPAFRKLALSLTELPSSLAAHEPVFRSRVVMRPEGAPLLSAAQMGINRDFDITLPDMQTGVIRHPLGMLSTEFTPTGIVRHLTTSGLPVKSFYLNDTVANATEPLVVAIPDRHTFEGTVFGDQPGVGNQFRRVSGSNKDGVITLQIDNLGSTSSEVFTIAADGASLVFDPFNPTSSQLRYNLFLEPFTYGAFVY